MHQPGAFNIVYIIVDDDDIINQSIFSRFGRRPAEPDSDL